MTFLKKFGMIVANIAKIIIGIGPLLPTGDKKVADTLNSVASIILTVEAVGQSLSVAGPDKLKAATPLVAQLILQSDLLSGKRIDNPELFKSGCEAIADGMAKLLNSVKADDLEDKSIPK